MSYENLRLSIADRIGVLTVHRPDKLNALNAATIEELKSTSPDIELNVTGTVKLAKRLEYSEPAIEVRLKPDPEFQKRLGLLGSALSMVGADPKDPAWRLGRLSGYLGRPQFR